MSIHKGLDPERVRAMYVDERMTATAIAAEMRVSRQAIFHHLRKMGVQRRKHTDYEKQVRLRVRPVFHGGRRMTAPARSTAPQDPALAAAARGIAEVLCTYPAQPVDTKVTLVIMRQYGLRGPADCICIDGIDQSCPLHGGVL